MFLDNALMFFKDAAFDAAPVELDLGVANVGRGEPLKIFFGAGGDLAGSVVLTLESATESGGTYNPLQEWAISETNAKEGAAMYFPFPSEQYLRLTMSGPTAGTNINCGVVLDAQSGM
jgi:hypothetical protein